MCELYLSASRTPHCPDEELRQLQRHGGAPWTNLQGWGMAWWQTDADGGFGLEKHPQPALGSQGYQGLLDRAYPSPLYLLHLRAASSGGVSRANTQPYRFDWNGTPCAYLHNGELKRMKTRLLERFGSDPRDGNADSEGGMILLSDLLAKVKSVEAAWAVFQNWAQDMKGMGIANFIVALGLDVFVHGHRRSELGGDALDDPGLYLHQTEDRLRLSSESMGDDEPLERGTLLWTRGPEIVARGLSS